jgi:DNA-binding MurR/RpiR family transcriptional regulator
MPDRETPKSLSLARRIRDAIGGLSRAERRVARALYASNFEAALWPVAALAESAGVSAPSVLRFTAALGFVSYPDFQAEAKAQLADRVESPATLYERAMIRTREARLDALSASISKCVDATLSMIDEGELERVVKHLANPRRNIWTIGGQASSALADMLAVRLFQLRHHVQCLSSKPLGYSMEGQLPFIGPRDVVVAFDFRRYQVSTVNFCGSAHSQGSTVVLITDPWLSPIADIADAVLTIEPDDGWAVDFVTPCLAIIDVLQTSVLARLDTEAVMERMRLCDELASGLIGRPAPWGLRHSKSDEEETA